MLSGAVRAASPPRFSDVGCVGSGTVVVVVVVVDDDDLKASEKLQRNVQPHVKGLLFLHRRNEIVFVFLSRKRHKSI